MIMKKYTRYLLIVSTFALCMEQDEMTIVRRFEEAKPFEGKIVAYQPRTMLGERYQHQLNPDNPINYGYINKRFVFKDENIEITMPYLYLLTLSHWLDYCPTYRISNETLSREHLVLRLARICEVEKIKQVMQSNLDLDFHYNARESTDTCRFMRRNYRDMQKIIDKQLELKSQQS